MISLRTHLDVTSINKRKSKLSQLKSLLRVHIALHFDVQP